MEIKTLSFMNNLILSLDNKSLVTFSIIEPTMLVIILQCQI
jgi:hypothetical protein